MVAHELKISSSYFTLEKNLMYAMYLATFIGTVYAGLQSLTIVVVSICMLLLTLKGKMVSIVPLSVFFNDAFGLLPGNIPIYYLFVMCFTIDLGLRLYRKPRFRVDVGRIIFILFSLVVNLQMYFTDFIRSERLLIYVFLMIWGYETIKKVEQENDFNNFFTLCSITIVFIVVVFPVPGFP